MCFKGGQRRVYLHDQGLWDVSVRRKGPRECAWPEELQERRHIAENEKAGESRSGEVDQKFHFARHQQDGPLDLQVGRDGRSPLMHSHPEGLWP